MNNLFSKTDVITSLRPYIYNFFVYIERSNIDLYNEFSFQHELGVYLRNTLVDYQVQFERNISYFTNEKNIIKKK